MKGSPLARLRSGAAARAGGALLAALALVAGLGPVAEIHPHEGLASDLAAHGSLGETVFVGASHPGSAPHVEPAGTETVFRCPVCVLHHQVADETPPRAVAARLPSPSDRPTVGRSRVPGAAPALPGGSRAPPASR